MTQPPPRRPAPRPAPGGAPRRPTPGNGAEPRAAAPAPARIEILQGPKAGDEFGLAAVETSIGRHADNQIVIPDISVSRKHVIIRRDGDGYLLVDLGSGNGTKLNGGPVEGEVLLQDGDRITMGKTEVVFHGPRRSAAASAMTLASDKLTRGGDPSSPFSGRDAMTGRVVIDPKRFGNRRRRRIVLLLGLLAGVSALVGGAIALRRHSMQQVEQLAQVEQVRLQAEGKVAEFVESGKNAAKGDDFAAAAKAFEQAIEEAKRLELDPRDIESIQRRLAYAQQESKSQAQFAKANELVTSGKLIEAVAALKEIPEESAFHDRIPEVQANMKAKIPERAAAARAAIAQKDFAGARAAMAELEAIDPRGAELPALAKAIEEAERGGGKAAPSRKGGREGRAAAPEPTDEALDSFQSGGLDEAIGQATRCDHPKCKALREKLLAFRGVYRDLEAPGNAEKAAALLRQIPGGTSAPYMSAIAGRAASSLVKEGVRAMAADNLPKAFQAFTRAQQVDPDNVVATKHLRTIHVKARELFEQAYVAKGVDPDRARRDFETVLTMTAPGDELNQKAKKHLKSLGED